VLRQVELREDASRGGGGIETAGEQGNGGGQSGGSGAETMMPSGVHPQRTSSHLWLCRLRRQLGWLRT
jgi:hypothetical protein